MPAFHFDIKVLPAQGIITVKIIVWLLALWPFLALVYGVLTQQLGPNPVETLTRDTGWWTLVLLCVTLSVT
ncbi:MAG: sulfoxide reductase heme-binding subunit YedZ, partial [Burkholderiales bacterium]